MSVAGKCSREEVLCHAAMTGLEANREEGSVHCHNILITNPLSQSTLEKKKKTGYILV